MHLLCFLAIMLTIAQLLRVHRQLLLFRGQPPLNC